MPAKRKKPYKPNQVPKGEQIAFGALSMGLLLYGTAALLRNDLFIPGKHSGGVHFHGIPLYILYTAILCAASSMVSVIVDHYDKRENEKSYQHFARATAIAGWVLYIMALFLEAVLFKNATRI